MTFLAPIPAIIAAAVAVPALLVLYFLKLRRRPVRVGSTMLWSQAAEDLQANVPFKWLRPSLLLFLQLLILAALLLALARPAINAPGEMPGQVFIVIDRSASMRATDMPEGRSRFDAAIGMARRTVERMMVGSFQGEITIITFAASAEIVAGPSRSRGELLRALESVRPSDEPGRLEGALQLVRALATPADPESEDAVRSLLAVCSDGSSAGGLPALASEITFQRAAPEGRVGENLGFVAVAARRDSEAPSMLRVFARVSSNLAEPTTLGISVRIGEEVVARRPLEVAPMIDGAPGQTPVSLAVDAPGAALLTLTLDRRDSLAADDSVSLRIEAPRRPAVLLVRAEQAETAGSGWLLTDVLRELDLSALTLISSDRLLGLGTEAYSGMDLVIFDAAPAPGLPPIPSVHFGSPPSFPGTSSSEGTAGVQPILAWERSHPIMRDVALDAVRIGKTRLLAPSDSADSGSFVELARTASGVVLALVEHERVRHVVAGFDLVQSTWPVHYSFPIFLANLVESLPGAGALGAGWGAVTGEPVVLPQPIDADRAVLRAPGGGEQALPPGPIARLGLLGQAGVWRIGDSAIPVNLLSERESSLEAPATLAVPGVDGRADRSEWGAGEPREIWPWLLIVAAGLLAIEWVLFGLRVRV